ncbi:hypothetical protein T069G_05466 [Trichoderma breve]|uniref:Uncharacterized protein n=1 Tax=Trichoderma breve TaxID=2034170 RepID=A0A9W9E652_9HYPO|nr:hypothetical protein T069G_05466 [Trichoderma breve]KAJ4860478.1 hypothetical protein T069G_05466 [Trichoderma breve]
MFTSKSLYSGLSFTFLALSLVLLIAGQRYEPSDLECVQSVSSWSPAWDAVEYTWQTFQNGFSQKSIYRGVPTLELEEAWNASLQHDPIIIPTKQLTGLHDADTQLVQSENGNGALAYLEVFRNLGCLNLLRQHTYREEYDYSYLDAFQGTEEQIMARVDGCVQRLREVLMCLGDTTPYLIMLTPEKAQKESPDFNTLHNCRNFDKILEWTKERESPTLHKLPNLYSLSRESSKFCTSAFLPFVGGGLLGSIITQAVIPRANWHSCQQLGLEAAARPPTSSTPPQAPLDIFWDNTDLSTHHMVRTNGTYNQTSPFRGPPTKEVDQAWGKYWQTWTFSVDEEQFKASMPQYTEEAVRLDDGRYLATFEYTHQLHCLYNLFRASYMDSYPDEKASYDENPQEWHGRVDHCIEILRQKLECDRDTGLVLYDWVKGRKAPTANFNVARMCYNWEPVEKWAQNHEVVDFPKKPKNVVQLSRIP